MTARQTLKQLLKLNKLLVAPGCFDGLSARLVQEAGFEAAYLSGGAVARSMGIPDIGLHGTFPNPMSPPSGCAFHPRCPSCFTPCITAYPANDSVIGGSVRCHLHDNPGRTPRPE